MIKFKSVIKNKDLEIIERMAEVIWYEHYTPIIGKEQVDYMLEKFQSAKSMREQIEKGYTYITIKKNKNSIGYLAYEQRQDTLFLSKIYLLKNERGKGFGKLAMNHIFQTARGKGCNSVRLTVNRFNQNSISAYQRIGFEKRGEVVQDIGNGFVMDDYIMEKSLM
ncbi:GNAT family N-acetyltransferase [Lutimonas saemankumensis]|uniref:GNAT family N-acetyltransferase n=1 Tax=Lutimonas saemankumensis TaxID=483016 RepID=UPI001CD4FDE8|nr:GNAT family N-acetyltransferase [Lutimonas saemankumensis]MCA0933642.1 GNAT family N-acetyltransferase [Lutimonas saemankumensis]